VFLGLVKPKNLGFLQPLSTALVKRPPPYFYLLLEDNHDCTVGTRHAVKRLINFITYLSTKKQEM